MTVEEATSRFALIAEAYQTLSDPVQRYDYDLELLHMEDEEEKDRLYLQEAERIRTQQQRDQKQHDKQQSQYHGGYDSPSLYNKMRDKASSLHESLNNIDPWKVFEDFFFQESSIDESNAYNDSSRTTTQQQQEAEKEQPNRNSYQNNQEPHVSETTVHRGYDPYIDADVYTVFRREDYTNGEYRVIGQDFAQGVEVDPYTGFVLREYYSAITGSYLVEEGSTQHEDDEFVNDLHDDKLYGQPDQKQHSDATRDEPESLRKSTSRLEQGESISLNPELDPWLSPNGMFEAYLTSTCELRIIRRDREADQDSEDEIDPDDMIVWSSETYIPDTRAHGCHLTLSSWGKLVLSIDYGSGIGKTWNSLLWTSPTPPVVPYWIHGDEQQSVTFFYYASLDDDGVIAVYRVRELSDCDEKRHENPQSTGKHQSQTLKRPKVIDLLGSVYGRISKTSIECGQTKAALVYDQLRHNVGSIFLGRPRSAGSASSGDSPPFSTNDGKRRIPTEQLHHECVYSTSPTGCFSPGRNAIHLTKTLARSIKRSVRNMDSQIDNIISILTQPADEYEYDTYDAYDDYSYSSAYQEEEDDDDDILDALLRVTDAAGKIGLQAAQIGIKQGRNVAGKVVGKMKSEIPQIFGKMKERVMHSYDDFGNS